MIQGRRVVARKNLHQESLAYDVDPAVGCPAIVLDDDVEGCRAEGARGVVLADCCSWRELEVQTIDSTPPRSRIETRVRRCADPRCGRVFQDETKNGRRRWCDMKVCGNRAKVQRFRRHIHRSSRS
jgi:hypothetical protein